jgi:phosphatidylglycerophosphate synthase
VAREPRLGALAAGASGVLLLVGGHRANHGAGGPTDRMLDDLLDRFWDATVLAAIAWTERNASAAVAIAALAALCLSFLSSYVRARGASLSYSVEESHITRGVRYGLVTAGLAFGWLSWTLWLAAALSALAAFVRATQVVREERA